MSEFEAFGSVQAPEVQESDPAADFLAREQDQLAEIEGEDFGFTSGETGQSEQQNTGEITKNLITFVILSFDSWSKNCRT